MKGLTAALARLQWRVRRTYRRAVDWSRVRLDALEPTPATTRWIGRAVLVGILAVGAWFGAGSLHLRQGVLVDALAGALIAFLLFGLARLVLWLGRHILAFMRRHGTPAGLGAVLVLLFLLVPFGLPLPLTLAVGLALALALVLLGAGVALLAGPGARRWAAGSVLVAALAVVGGLGWWMGAAGDFEDPVAELVERPDDAGGAFAGLLEPGPYRVAVLTYGSGEDRWRPEYAGGVAWTSETVDAREMLERPSGWRVSLRERWWGFGLDALPLNGRLWYPEDAEGELPLVLVVHGNHDMMRFSDGGYAWLGEHLASRGHLVVSVDQNFLNGGLFGNLNRENATRGWMLLRHLAAWRQWKEAPAHPLHSRVDLDRVVLIGHSRGGEAVALAAAFNRLAHHPEDARVAFDFGFGIRGVVGIAPVDGQFWPSGKPTPLADVSYFTIHGGYDADVSSFHGDRQLVRVRPDIREGRFRAALYMHHANHGQFNTRWGSDATPPMRNLLNEAALLPGEDQRRAALLYMTGFVEAALAPPDVLPPYFCDARAAGRLLPETVYVARCDDGRRVVLADFEEDLDLRTGSLPGVSLAGHGLALWAERDVGFRSPAPRRQTGVFLGWRAAKRDDAGSQGTEPAGAGFDDSGDAEEGPYFEIGLDAAARDRLALSERSVLWLDLAQADGSPPEEDGEDAGQDAEEDGELGAEESVEEGAQEDAAEKPLRDPIQLTIELEDADGVRAARPLSDFARLPPPLPVRHTRLRALDQKRYNSPTEPLLQSVAVPLEAFAGEDGIALDALRSVRLRFDDATEGVLIIERVAMDPGGP